MLLKPNQTFEVPVIKRKINNHDEIKNKILDDIDNASWGINQFENVSNTDWNVGREHERNYLNHCWEELRQHTSVVCGALGFQQWDIINCWYQQYTEGSDHNWHVHPDSHWTNVYYVEFPANSSPTEVCDFYGNVVKLDAEEGYIISFPSLLMHRSPPQFGDGRKTIISFNSIME